MSASLSRHVTQGSDAPGDVVTYIVYGAGAIGSALGAYLHQAGHNALLVGRTAHVRQIGAHGLEIRGPEGISHVRVAATDDLRTVGVRPASVVLLCVKSQDTETALREIRAAGGDPEFLPIFCVQNSIVNEGLAQRYFAHVYGVMVNVPGVFLEPGVVSNPIRGNRGYMDIGRYPSGLDQGATQVAEAIASAGYATNPHPEVMTAKAAKFLGNLGNAVRAITDGQSDDRAFLDATIAEGEATLEAAGIPIEPRALFNARVARHRGETVLAPGERNLGSTWQSLLRGAPSLESDYLNGEIVRLGRLHGVATPYNAVVQETVSRLHASGATPGRHSCAELEAMVRARIGG